MQGNTKALQSRNKTRQSFEQNKSTKLLTQSIVKAIEKGTGDSLKELKSLFGEEKLLYYSLKYVTTTKKSICTALDIPIEAACRYKRHLQKRGLLKESVENVICPYTSHPAKLISTNPNEFERLLSTNQLKLF